MKVSRERARHRQNCQIELEVLRHSLLFEHVCEQDLKRITVEGRCRVYGALEEISRPEQDDTAIFFLAFGLCRLYAASDAGEEQTLALLTPGELCGHVFLQRTHDLGITLQSVTDGTKVYRLLWQRVAELERTDPDVVGELRKVAVNRLHETERWLVAMRFESVASRVEGVLKKLAKLSDDHIVLLTHGQLAALVGSSREGVTKALPELRERGLIHTHQGRSGIVVTDPDQPV